ncbi:MAG: methyltransferase domain-containing protein [Alphaproteobacteria bacterium]
MIAATVDRQDLETQVKDMYRRVAQDPHGDFHFEMGRPLAERLGYPRDDLDRIPAEAIESFAGVGYYFHLAKLKEGESVLDLGSGSGTDSFFAALQVRPSGRVVGVDMTDEQRIKAVRLCERAGLSNITYLKGYIEDVPVDGESFDAVISNGVINLSVDKTRVFREVARVLKPGGRLAVSDIVSETQLPDGIVCNATLWAACIGGAVKQDDYCATIEAAGLKMVTREDNPQYRFISDRAIGASKRYGVKSISLLAVKPQTGA